MVFLESVSVIVKVNFGVKSNRSILTHINNRDIRNPLLVKDNNNNNVQPNMKKNNKQVIIVFLKSKDSIG